MEEHLIIVGNVFFNQRNFNEILGPSMQRRALYYSLPTFLFLFSFYCRLFFLAVQINGKLEEEQSKLGCMIWRKFFSAPSYPWPPLSKLRLPLEILTKMHKLEISIPRRVSCLLNCLACFHIYSLQRILLLALRTGLSNRQGEIKNQITKITSFMDHQNDLTSLDILRLQSD